MEMKVFNRKPDQDGSINESGPSIKEKSTCWLRPEKSPRSYRIGMKMKPMMW